MSDIPYTTLKFDELPSKQSPAEAYLGSHPSSIQHRGEECLRKNPMIAVIVAFLIGLALGRAVQV